MMNTINTMVGGAVIAAVGYVATLPFFKTYTPIGLEIAQLEYLEIDGKGYFRQQINSVSGEPVPADWAVQITRVEDGVSRELCTGSSRPEKPGSYSGAVDTWTLDDWVGDDCPDVLRNGDIAEVSWTYTNNYDKRTSLGVVYIIEK